MLCVFSIFVYQILFISGRTFIGNQPDLQTSAKYIVVSVIIIFDLSPNSRLRCWKVRGEQLEASYSLKLGIYILCLFKNLIFLGNRCN